VLPNIGIGLDDNNNRSRFMSFENGFLAGNQQAAFMSN